MNSFSFLTKLYPENLKLLPPWEQFKIKWIINFAIAGLGFGLLATFNKIFENGLDFEFTIFLSQICFVSILIFLIKLQENVKWPVIILHSIIMISLGYEILFSGGFFSSSISWLLFIHLLNSIWVHPKFGLITSFFPTLLFATLGQGSAFSYEILNTLHPTIVVSHIVQMSLLGTLLIFLPAADTSNKKTKNLSILCLTVLIAVDIAFAVFFCHESFIAMAVLLCIYLCFPRRKNLFIPGYIIIKTCIMMLDIQGHTSFIEEYWNLLGYLFIFEMYATFVLSTQVIKSLPKTFTSPPE